MIKYILPIAAAVLLTAGCSVPLSHLKASDDKRITLKGDIQNHIISATSTVAGKIVEMNKQPGEPVKKGDIIAVIDHTNQTYAVDQLQAAVDMKRAKLEELQAGSRPQQIEQAEAQARAAKAQLDLKRSGSRKEQIEQGKLSVAIAEEAAQRTELSYRQIEKKYNKALNLYQEGAVTKEDWEDAQYNFDTAAKQLTTANYQLETAKQQLALLENGATPEEISAAQANYDAANAQLNLLKSGVTKQSIDAAKADLEQTTAQLNQAKYQLENSYIRALADGIMISKNAELGDVVNVSSNLADIAVEKDVYVLCYLPNEYLDRIYYNQSLSVVTSLGEQTGRVSYIALNHEYTPKDKQSSSNGNRITTKIKVAIDDAGGKLKSGMTAEVIVPLK